MLQIQRRLFSAQLKARMTQVIAEKQKEMIEFKKEYGDTVIGDVTVNKVIGGMRGMVGLIYETSKLHPIEGINYRGHDLYSIMQNAPKSHPDGEPLPEGVLWLLLTGEYPNKEQMEELRVELFNRGKLTDQEEKLIKSFPPEMHPMTQFSMGVLACQPRSQFAKAYKDGIHKTKYWEPTFEDCLDLCGKISRIGAIVFHNSYGDNTAIPEPSADLDFGANFARMLGWEDEEFWELVRLYLVLHFDHEGGNVSAHTSHLVGSALADPYLSFSASMNGLAGPLHGLANQECLHFLHQIHDKYGEKWTEHDIREFVRDTLASGKVVPGYGHAVLR